jgi:hypothetical protein
MADLYVNKEEDKKSTSTDSEISTYAEDIFKAVDTQKLRSYEQKLSVSPVIAEIASWYERVRNAMEYAEDEVLLRQAVERILRRHLILFKAGKDIAPSLVRELAWAKYVPSGTIPESLLKEIADRIDLYLDVFEKIKHNTKIGDRGSKDYILQLLSVDITLLLGPDLDTEAVASSFLKVMEDKVSIPALEKKEKDALVIMSVYRSFAKEDQAFLRFRLFTHYFGSLKESNKEKAVDELKDVTNKIENTLKHPFSAKVYSFTKKNTAPFLILKDLLKENRNRFRRLAEDKQAFDEEITEICNKRYKGLRSKVRRAIARSTVFLFVTKALIALFIEGAFEKFFYGEVMWTAIGVNTIFPPLLLLSSLFFIVTPGEGNTKEIIRKIRSLLFDSDAQEFDHLTIRPEEAGNPYLNAVFVALWIAVLIFVLAGVNSLLTWANVHLLSQAVFVFFLAVVLFLVYRIRESARIYNVEEERLRWWTLVFDFLFMPLVHIGQRLTLTVAKLNVFLMLFDLLIETPFKTLFSFFEQWFFFLKSQREKLD